MKAKQYEGIDKDPYGAMNPTGNIIRDAWVFGVIPETETCEGWSVQRIDSLYDKVHAAWEPYGNMVSNLPDGLKERHQRIYDEAIAKARDLGWNPELNENM
jgi:hypothetical protein